jgi:hypothetical protein
LVLVARESGLLDMDVYRNGGSNLGVEAGDTGR